MPQICYSMCVRHSNFAAKASVSRWSSFLRPHCSLIVTHICIIVKNYCCKFKLFFEVVTVVSVIRELCQNKNMSFRKLEEAIGLPYSSISRWDKNLPSIDKVFSVAQYFGVSMEFLLTGKEQTAPEDGLSFAEHELISLFSALTEELQEIALIQIRSLAQFQTERDSAG